MVQDWLELETKRERERDRGKEKKPVKNNIKWSYKSATNRPKNGK